MAVTFPVVPVTCSPLKSFDSCLESAAVAAAAAASSAAQQEAKPRAGLKMENSNSMRPSDSGLMHCGDLSYPIRIHTQRTAENAAVWLGPARRLGRLEL